MGVSRGTKIRTVVLAITLLNNILTACGINPLPWSEEELYEIVSIFFTAGAALWAWWKNNSFTVNAISADCYLDKLRSMDKE